MGTEGILIRLTGVISTTSTEALLVVLGIMPLTYKSGKEQYIG